MFDDVSPKNRWKLHPQPSSESKAREALSRFCSDFFDVSGSVVLDPYCGTGTLVFVAADFGAVAIGSDIEDWSDYLRRPWSPSQENPRFVWRLDAVEAVRAFLPRVIFTDPPNPRVLVGGRQPSAYRDTGVSGADLRSYWRGHLHPWNRMGSSSAVKHLRRVLHTAWLYDVEFAIVNVFDDSLMSALRGFRYERLYDTYFVIDVQSLYAV